MASSLPDTTWHNSRLNISPDRLPQRQNPITGPMATLPPVTTINRDHSRHLSINDLIDVKSQCPLNPGSIPPFVVTLAERAQAGHSYNWQEGQNSSKDEDKPQTQSYLLSLPFELRMTILNHVCPDYNKNKRFSGTLYSLYVHSPPPKYLRLVCC
jgi:hypothetical protein